MKNRYVVRARISEIVFRRFLRHVAADLTAVQIAQLTGLNRNTVNRLLAGLRVRMAEACARGSPFRGHVELDESYFGPRRVRGKPGRGAGGKTIVRIAASVAWMFAHRVSMVRSSLSVLDCAARRIPKKKA